jgi:hypothetical protein
MIPQKLHPDEGISINERMGIGGKSLYNRDVKKKEKKS